MNKKILAGLVLFLVSFSVSAEGISGNIVGTYKVFDDGIDDVYTIISFEESENILLKVYDTTSTLLAVCTGVYRATTYSVQIQIICEDLGNGSKGGGLLVIDLDGVSDFDNFTTTILTMRGRYISHFEKIN